MEIKGKPTEIIVGGIALVYDTWSLTVSVDMLRQYQLQVTTNDTQTYHMLYDKSVKAQAENVIIIIPSTLSTLYRVFVGTFQIVSFDFVLDSDLSEEHKPSATIEFASTDSVYDLYFDTYPTIANIEQYLNANKSALIERSAKRTQEKE